MFVLALLLCSCATAAVPNASKTATRSAVPLKPIVLEGSPTIRFRPDREYAVRQMESAEEPRGPTKDLRIYMLIPKDEQSAATVGIGAGGHRKTEDTIARMYQGAKVKKVAGTAGRKAVEWWHYQDDVHLYSTCYASLPDKAGAEHSVYFDLVANTPERLASLEETIATIELE